MGNSILECDTLQTLDNVKCDTSKTDFCEQYGEQYSSINENFFSPSVDDEQQILPVIENVEEDQIIKEILDKTG